MLCRFRVGLCRQAIVQSQLLPTLRSNKFATKVLPSCEDAIRASGLKNGDTLIAGGFGVCGAPVGMAHAIADMGFHDLTVVSNNCGLNHFFLGLMLNHGQIRRMLSSYVGENEEFARQYLGGELEVEFVPQGTLAERIRAGGAGIPAFYTKTGVGTWIEKGGVPIRHDETGGVSIRSMPKETREFDGHKYVMEEAIRGEVAIIKAHQADEFGNCRFRGTSRNFNPECASAGKFAIVECEEIVPLGHFKPEDIHLQGAFVHAVVKNDSEKRIEILKNSVEGDSQVDVSNLSERAKGRYRIVKRAAQELSDGMVVNLGIGMPTLVPNFLDSDTEIWLQSENGLLGMGPYPLSGEEDPDMINAGKETCTTVAGASIFSSSQSFAMIRGGHVDVSILGSMEVSRFGDIANWIVPGAFVKGMGGAMDLVASGSRVIVAMEHTDKKGNPKIVDECSLPLTGERCVSQIITELAVFDVHHEHGMHLRELMDGARLEDVIAKTGCKFEIPSDLQTVDVLP